MDSSVAIISTKSPEKDFARSAAVSSSVLMYVTLSSLSSSSVFHLDLEPWIAKHSLPNHESPLDNGNAFDSCTSDLCWCWTNIICSVQPRDQPTCRWRSMDGQLCRFYNLFDHKVSSVCFCGRPCFFETENGGNAPSSKPVKLHQAIFITATTEHVDTMAIPRFSVTGIDAAPRC